MVENPNGGKFSYLLLWVVLLVLTVVFFAAEICFGSVSISLQELWATITGSEAASETTRNIILQLRLPRALAALILGGALALSGYLLQTFFHNPIAGPFVLGISSGAKLAVALVMVFSLEHALRLGSLGMIGAAFVGAMVSMGFVLLLSKRLPNMSYLVVAGVMTGYICSAITDFVVTFAADADIVNLHNWSRGSFSGIAWRDVWVMLPVVAVTGVMVFLLSKPIGAYRMGENYARSVGVNVHSFRVLLVFLSSILSACVTAFAGPVSFVGIAVPQLVRGIFHTSEPKKMIPACFLGGAICCLACDLIARTVFAPTELSISTVTAVFGAPVVIWVMVKRRGREE